MYTDVHCSTVLQARVDRMVISGDDLFKTSYRDNPAKTTCPYAEKSELFLITTWSMRCPLIVNIVHNEEPIVMLSPG